MNHGLAPENRKRLLKNVFAWIVYFQKSVTIALAIQGEEKTMPLVAINLSDTLMDQIKPLVEKGQYKSFEAFLEIAAFNQLALERGANPSEIVERGHRKIKHDRGD